MMHDPDRHPDDERLSAFAAADEDALDDRALRDHVEGCAACGSVVAELLAMRTALAQLPDVPPSRPLRLLPPAPEPRRASIGTWTRRLFAPMLAAGLVLAVGGGIGAYVEHGPALLTSAGARGAAAPERASATDHPAPAAAPTGMGTTSGGEATDTRDDGSAVRILDRYALDGSFPWLPIVGAGLALVAVALVLRFVVQPRAG